MSDSETTMAVETKTVVGEVQALAAVLEAHRGERHVIVLSPFPDPDAIASAFVHQLISAVFEIEADIVYMGRIKQNRALVNLLDIQLIRFEDSGLDLGQYDGAVFVNHQGERSNVVLGALKEAGVPILIVVDHHEPRSALTAEFCDVRRVGATATLYGSYLQHGLIELDRSRRDHVMAATALMHGIMMNTNRFIRAGAMDFEVASFLSRYRDVELLQQLAIQSRPRSVMEVIRRSLDNREIVENFSIAGIGYIRSEDRDAIPQAAEFLLTEENIHTAVVYGIVTEDARNEYLVGCVRTARITLDPDEFIRDILDVEVDGQSVETDGRSAGTFEIPVGFLSGGRNEEYRALKWKVFDAQMKFKIFAKLGVERDWL